MNVKKIAPLIVALILGGIAAKMAFDFVQKRQSGIVSEIKHPQMVVAKRGVEAGTALKSRLWQVSRIAPNQPMEPARLDGPCDGVECP